MLNCTDLACVLHHHHFYAHLHHLKNHLQDDNDHQDLSDGSDLNSNYINHFDSDENGSELSSFSHVDAPSDTIYMICGVVIAMLLVGLIIILVAVTINKLRKRDESITTTAVSIESQQHGRQSRSNSSDNNHYHEAHDQQIFTNSTAMTDCNDNSALELETITFARTSGGCNTTNGWVFPPKAPSPNISNCANHDSMITVGERNGFKGFKKQFSGRFKRLVSNKTKDTTSPIPAELKPQLKTIYVY
ncbi:uncharacterized protein LOC111683110 isoform X2 [Lucilia cuprina]|uniref:uncharacterized protein LOC111683110 isoform X2 n=1 Tax=Lucilia cuprina TaxID=7375 RepID=UPI001F0686E4|nr:uncharacterized protein LOC111683110 isoform X2 [Lucilia cuprina]